MDSMASARRIEIVGLAGSGKSVLARALCDRDRRWQLTDTFHASERGHWRYLAHATPQLLPLLARAGGPAAVSWEEFKLLVYLHEWPRHLRAENTTGATVLDQGPLFALARLLWGDGRAARTRAFQAWVDAMLVAWAGELTAIVQLVAPREVLLERINSRSKPHEAKCRSETEALQILDSHDRAYRQLFERIDAIGGPPLLRLDTSAITTAHAATQILDALDSVPAVAHRRVVA